MPSHRKQYRKPCWEERGRAVLTVLRVTRLPQQPGEGHLIGVKYSPNLKGLAEGRASSHSSAVTQTHGSNLTAESPPWRFVWLQAPSEPAGFCSLPVSINEATALAVEDMGVSDSVSHLCRGNRRTRTILKRLWKLCTYIIHVSVGENTSPSSFLQSLILMLPKADVCCNYY